MDVLSTPRDRIKLWCLLHQKKQVHIAAELGVPKQSISKIAAGTINSGKLFDSVAQFMKCEGEWLANGTGNPPAWAEPAAQLFAPGGPSGIPTGPTALTAIQEASPHDLDDEDDEAIDSVHKQILEELRNISAAFTDMKERYGQLVDAFLNEREERIKAQRMLRSLEEALPRAADDERRSG